MYIKDPHFPIKIRNSRFSLLFENMMCDTNWCTFCDSAISPHSDSLYCSERCLRQDALLHHPLLGYDFSELQGFPHVKNTTTITTTPNHIYSTNQIYPTNHIQPTRIHSSSLSSSLSSTYSEDDPFAALYKPRHHLVN
ncbi:unnamed protein product [Rhizopus stolonifer]